MTESPQMQSVVVLDPSQVPAARTLAAAHGVEVEQVPRRGIEPVATVTLVLVGATTAVGAVLHVLEQRKSGQVIDLRPSAPKAFYRTPDVVYGTVVIVTTDRKVTVEVKEPDGMFGKVISTLPGLLSGDGGSAEQVAPGAAELNRKTRERLTKVSELKIAEGPLTGDKGGFVCLVRLADWYLFISEDGKLREEVFEENVRGYEGATVINRAIAESLGQGDLVSPDFWWLNNGVTVLGQRVQSMAGKRLTIDDPQVVNGLQTSRNIFQYFSGSDGLGPTKGVERHVLVRIIEAQDDTLVSQIIKATNSQNRVSVASLRATEPIQRNIEEHFGRKSKSILVERGTTTSGRKISTRRKGSRGRKSLKYWSSHKL